MAKRLRSPIKWFGGKGHLAPRILEYVTEHREYVEPFFGGGSVFFAKAPALVETVNDLDSGVTGFFRVLRDNPEELERLCRYTPYSRELYYDCRTTWETEQDSVKRAWKWFVVARMSFSGAFGESLGTIVTKSNRKMASTCSEWQTAIGNIGAIAARLRRTQIENAPAVRVIQRYCTDNSLCYCDPPYPSGTRRAGKYKKEMTDADHEELLVTLLAAPGKVLLSSYPNALYEDTLKPAGWSEVRWERSCDAAGRTRASGLQGKGNVTNKQKRTEVLWLNPRAMTEENGIGTSEK